MGLALINQENLGGALEHFIQELSQNSFFSYQIEVKSSYEKIIVNLFPRSNSLSFSYHFKLKTSKTGRNHIKIEKLEVNEDVSFLATHPFLHDAGIIETLIYLIRTLIFIGNFFQVNYISFQLPQEEADNLMYFSKIFTNIQDVYKESSIITTFKMGLNTGLEQYFIATQEIMLKKIYQQLWLLQKEDENIRKYFQIKK
jgi:hypothetical protein